MYKDFIGIFDGVNYTTDKDGVKWIEGVGYDLNVLFENRLLYKDPRKYVAENSSVDIWQYLYNNLTNYGLSSGQSIGNYIMGTAAAPYLGKANIIPNTVFNNTPLSGHSAVPVGDIG